MMRLTFLFVLIGLMQVSASLYSQSTKLTLEYQNVRLGDVLEAIEQQSEFRFAYSNELIDVDHRINVVLKEKNITQILETILSGLDIRYFMEGRHVMLHPAGLGHKNLQQQLDVSGRVTNEVGEPVPGVTVVVKGTTSGVITDFDGNYTISNIPDNATLVFSFVGMRTQEISVSGRASINVTMSEEAKGLDEVIIVGYGTKKKRDVTGSITTISGEHIAESQSESFAEALQGRAAGVYVVSNSGKPGAGVSVRIRGIGGINNSEPLYIIDGVQIGGNESASSNPMASLNPGDIESIEVLKDASSSAIYGARGANGVVIISTKRGNKEKAKLTYSTSFGIQNETNPNKLGVLNAKEYAERVNRMQAAEGKDPIFGGPNTAQYPVEFFPAPSQLGKGTDWVGAMTNNNAPTHEHQLSVSGGNENHQVFLSLNYLDQTGIIIKSGFKRYSLRVNTDHTLNKWIKVGNSLSVAHTVQKGGTEDRGWGNLAAAYYYAPTIPLRNDDGSLAGPPTSFYPPSRTPYAGWTGTDRENKEMRLLGNVFAEIKPFKDLTFKTSLSVDANYYNNSSFRGSYDEGIIGSSRTDVRYASGNNFSWIWNNVLTWDKLTGKHHFTALAGTEAIEAKSDGLNATSAYLDDAIKVVRIAGSEQSNLEQGLSSYSLLSYFGNFSYNYDQRYYLEGNIRRDGSSRFGENSKWGVFPSFSVAWRLSKESFFPQGLADDLKLRLSYGEVGNDKIGNFSYIAPIGTVLYSMSNTNGSFETGAAINSLANPDLKWEISKQFNIGIDMLFLDNKLNIVADYFETKVEDMLLGLSIPAITGITNPRSINNASVIANAGSLKNKGFELEASYRSAVGDFRYGLNANLTTFNNEVTDIGNNEQLWGSANIKNGGPISRTIVGGPLGEFYGHVAEGIFQTQAEVDAANALDGNPSTPYQQTGTAPGDFKFKDLNGDHVINDEDRTQIGSPIPDFTYGFGIELGYKNFDFSALFTGVQGRDIYNAVRSELEASGGINANRSKTVLNAWNGEGTSNTIPRAYNSDPNFNGRISSMYVEDGSYLRLRNVRLAYNLPKQFASRLSMSNAQIYITGSNLFTFTKYKGYDPEVGNSNGNNLSSGVDLEIYPQAQTFHIGARITF